jgi:hypothetical protein
MNEEQKNRYAVCLKHLADEDSIFKDARCFIDAKELEERFPNECIAIKEALHITYRGI